MTRPEDHLQYECRAHRVSREAARPVMMVARLRARTSSSTQAGTGVGYEQKGCKGGRRSLFQRSVGCRPFHPLTEHVWGSSDVLGGQALPVVSRPFQEVAEWPVSVWRNAAAWRQGGVGS